VLQSLERVRPVMLDDIQKAQTRIAKSVFRTPLIRLDLGSDHPDVWLKLENLQPTLVDRGFYRGTTGLPAGHLEDPRVSAGKRQLTSTLTSTGIQSVTWPLQSPQLRLQQRAQVETRLGDEGGLARSRLRIWALAPIHRMGYRDRA